ncbi:MAG: hypothetical protein ACRCUQ_02680 [Alphaproteobacteria bacterium]
MRSLFKVCCFVVALGVSTHGFASWMDGLPGGASQAFHAVSHHTLFSHGEDSGDKSAGVVSRLKAFAPSMPVLGMDKVTGKVGAFTAGVRDRLPSLDDVKGKAGAFTASVRNHLPSLDTLTEKTGAVKAKLGGMFGSISEKFSTLSILMTLRKYLMKVVELPAKFFH